MLSFFLVNAFLADGELEVLDRVEELLEKRGMFSRMARRTTRATHMSCSNPRAPR